MEEKLPTRLRKGQIAEFIEHHEVLAREIVGHASLPAGAGLGLELVDQVDDVEEAAAGAIADRGAGDGDGQVGLARAGPPISNMLRS